MILHVNRLPADDLHEILCLICYFWKSEKICNRRLLQIIGGALRVNYKSDNTLFSTEYIDTCLVNIGSIMLNFDQQNYPCWWKTYHDTMAGLYNTLFGVHWNGMCFKCILS